MNAWGSTIGAWIHLPDDYNTTSQTYPLLIFFHGIGEAGTNLDAVLAQGIPKLISQGAKMDFTVGGKLYKFIVVSPQSPSGWMNADQTDAIIEDLKSRYRVDLNRIYLTGLSAGGYATWTYPLGSTTYANKVAAIVPVSAAGPDNQQNICNIATAKIPVWTLCGSVDQFIDEDRRLTDLINSCNPPVKALLTVTPGAGHSGSFWDQAYDVTNKYNTPNIYQWMLGYSRNGSTPPVNQPPVANAGPNQTITLPTSTTGLDGSASSDPVGSITAYSWAKISGPAGGTIASPNAAKTNISALAAGTYVFELTVTNDKGLTSKAQVTITVNAANQPPVANAGSNQTITLPVSTASLDGSASSTPTGTITTWAWAKISGPAGGAIATPNAAQTNISGLLAGTYVYELTVTNDKGLTSKAQVTITVNAAPSTPTVAKAGGSLNVTLPVSTANLDGSSSTGNIVTWAWSKLSGPAGGTIATPNAAKTAISGLVAGTYSYQLSITDDKGVSSTDILTVTVAAAPSGGGDVCNNCKLTLTPGTDGGLYIDGSKYNLQPGDTICIKGGTYTYAEFYNFNGAAGKPLVFINCGGKVTIGVNGNAGMNFRDSKYFKVTGSGSADKYGFYVTSGTPGKYLPSGFAAGKGCSDYEAERIEVSNVEAGFLCKVNPVCEDPSTQYPNFAIRNIIFHDLFIHETLGEAMYIGHTSPQGIEITCNDGSKQTLVPPKIFNCKVYNVTTLNSGWDGIQVSGVPEGLEIYNNTVTNYGTTDMGSQQAGIIFGGEGNGSVHDNIINGGTGNGMQIFGGGLIYVYNNVLNKTGVSPTEKQDAIFIDDKPTGYLYKPIQVYVFNNTVINSGRTGILFYNSMNTAAPGSKFYNNFIIAPGSWTASKGDKAYIDINPSVNPDITNNVYVLDPNAANFRNYAGADFHLATGSPAIDKGREVASFGVPGLNKDIDGNQRPYGTAVDAGAYEFTGGTPPVNQPPVAKPGNNVTITLPVNTTTLDGSASYDPDGTIVSYAWAKISGPAGGTIASPAAAKTVINGLVAGTYVYELTVTDNGGLTGKAQVTITVNAANQPPVANAGSNQAITLPVSTASLDGSASSTPTGTITAYSWAKISGPAGGAIATPNAAKTNVSGLVAGSYVYELTVTNDKGLSSKAQVTITVNATNQPPVANAGRDTTITLPVNNVMLSGELSKAPGGTIVTWLWTKVSGPQGGVITSPNTTFTQITNLIAGVYVFQLTVTDNNGASATASVTVTVNPPVNQPPVANAGNDVTLTLPNNSTTLDGTASYDPDGSIQSYQWTYISGPSTFAIANPTAPKTLLQNLQAGVYVFELTVTDNRGAKASARVTITVQSAANKPPVANAGSDKTLTLPQNSTILDGSASYDPDGTIVSYAWTQVWGAAATLSTPNAAQTGVSGLQQGTYIFELRVTDNSGASSTARVTVTVNAANSQPPVSLPGADQTIRLPESTVTLDGTASYAPNGQIRQYSWKLVSGPGPASIISPSAARTRITGLSEGIYVFELMVTDNLNNTARATVQITVQSSSGDKQLRLFPNPAVDNIQVRLKANTIQNATLRIFNSNGTLVRTIPIGTQQETWNQTVNVNDLTGGLYIMKISGDRGLNISTKFVKVSASR